MTWAVAVMSSVKGADVLQQIICKIKISRSPTRHDNIDFRPIITRISEIVPLSAVTADKGYDSEENHVLVRELLHGFSIIPTRYEHVPIWKTHGTYRKQMKRGYSKLLNSQRNKNETIVSVIQRLFGEHNKLVRTQNREISFRCIAYNTHRLTNLTIIIDCFYKAVRIVRCQMGRKGEGRRGPKHLEQYPASDSKQRSLSYFLH
jgi:hypothetical protein